MVRVARIELASHPWEGYILPLNHTRALMFIIADAVMQLEEVINYKIP
jgi:hypothetical protein